MSTTVYWSFIDLEWMRATEPQSVRKSLYQKKIIQDTELMNFHKCPFLYEHLENTYALHSPYDYSFSIEDDKVTSQLHNQDFFNDHVTIRSLPDKCFSFLMPYVFFTEEDSLNVSLPTFPYLEDNNISARCIPFVSTIDIGKYFRTIDFSFFIKDSYDEFIIKENEIFGYAEFKTKDKIVFKEFYPTEKIKTYLKDITYSNQNKLFSFKKPEDYYKKFKLKKFILKEIKENLV